MKSHASVSCHAFISSLKSQYYVIFYLQGCVIVFFSFHLMYLSVTYFCYVHHELVPVSDRFRPLGSLARTIGELFQKEIDNLKPIS